MADSDNSTPLGSDGDQEDQDVTDGPATVSCTANRFKVRLDKVLLTGAVKAKYEVQGEVSVLGYHVGDTTPLARIKGLPLQWLPEDKDAGLLEFEIDTENHINNYIVLKLERKDLFHNSCMDHSFSITVSILQGLRRTVEEAEIFQLTTTAFKRGITARLFCTSTILDQDNRKFEIRTGEFHRHPELPDEHPHEYLPPSYTAVEVADPYIVATHSLLSGHCQVQFLLRVLHCQLRCLSALQIISRGDVVARANLIGQEQLVEFRDQYLEQENIFDFTLDHKSGERAMVVKGVNGNYVMVKASHQSSAGHRDTIKVDYYDFSNDTLTTIEQIEAHSCIELGVASVYPFSGYISVSDDAASIPESLALCFSVAILYNLCVPDRTREDRGLHEHAFFVAGGDGTEIPSNSCIAIDARQPDPTFLEELGWQEPPEDPHLPAYSTDLVTGDFPDGDHSQDAETGGGDGEAEEAGEDNDDLVSPPEVGDLNVDPPVWTVNHHHHQHGTL